MDESLPAEFVETEQLLSGLRDIHLPPELQADTSFAWHDSFFAPELLWPIVAYAAFCLAVLVFSYRRRNLWRRQAQIALAKLTKADAPLEDWLELRRHVLRHIGHGATLSREVFTPDAERNGTTENAVCRDIEQRLARV